jgi:hypothetical protein
VTWRSHDDVRWNFDYKWYPCGNGECHGEGIKVVWISGKWYFRGRESDIGNQLEGIHNCVKATHVQVVFDYAGRGQC